MSAVFYKQWFKPVNETRTPNKNAEHIRYIGTRPGVMRNEGEKHGLFGNVYDSDQDARELAGLLKGMLCHVNLIPVNTVTGNGYKKSSRIHIDKFKNILESKGIETTVRRELGSDINAACGQLRKNKIDSSANLLYES